MSLSQQNLEHVCAIVRRESGIVLTAAKRYLLESRLTQLATEQKQPTIDALVDAARGAGGHAIRARIVDTMTTNETSWFRDGHPYEAIAKDLMVRIRMARRRTKTLRIWSAACSTGQEPYSLIFTLAESCPDIFEEWNVRIHATDLSAEALARARSGVYSSLEVARGMSQARLRTFFEKHSGGWKVRPEYTSKISFQQMNLIGRWPMLPRFDLILLRNVLIYFDPETRRKIVLGMTERLERHGYFLIGGAETLAYTDVPLTRAPITRTVAYELSRRSAGR